MINWGIIGCGDVTEVKSGPAFNKVPESKLIAVMRRDATKAEDYAHRHHVEKWYADATALINDPDVNAIYIATPPSYHEAYTMEAVAAGKPAYVEKPMALDENACLRMVAAAKKHNVKLSIAHYRRAQPMFLHIKKLIDGGTIGAVRFVNLKMLQPAGSKIIASTEENWRVDPTISGGGLFHDLAPHQLDLMLYFFGGVTQFAGVSGNQAALYPADDIVAGQIKFGSGIIFSGTWCFTVPEKEALDVCEIMGSKGKIAFPVFGKMVTVTIGGKEEITEFDHPRHVQQPMIEKVVQYFLGKGPNPCPVEEATSVIQIMDGFTKKTILRHF